MIQAKIVSQAYEKTQVQKGAKFENGYTNILFRGMSRGRLPNFPVIAFNYIRGIDHVS